MQRVVLNAYYTAMFTRARHPHRECQRILRRFDNRPPQTPEQDLAVMRAAFPRWRKRAVKN